MEPPTKVSTALAPASVLAADWIVPAVGGTDLHAAWAAALDAWLDAAERRGGSANTRAAYRRDAAQFFEFCGHAPWNVTARDAESWMNQLRQAGASTATVNRKLAALSSFYQFVIEKHTHVDGNLVERTIYLDANGSARPNPFRKPERFAVQPYDKSLPLAVDVVRLALGRINQRTLLGCRDYALIVTFVYTGRRSHEIAGLRWGDIEVDEARCIYHYRWTGKGKRNQEPRTDELPAPAWRAITAYLRTTRRLETMRPDSYVFAEVYADRARYLPNVQRARHGQPPAPAPLSGSMINRIVKRRFQAAGVDPDLVHTHTLRHTATHLRWRDGQGQDILEISRFLGHSSVAVTQIYLSQKRKPIDSGWTEVEQLLNLSSNSRDQG